MSVNMETSQLKTGTFFFGGLIGFVAGLVVAGVIAIWVYQATPFRPESTPHAKLEPIKPKVEPKATGRAGELAKDEIKTDSERIVQPGTPSSAPNAAAATPPSTPAAGPAVTLKPASKADTEPAPSAEPRFHGRGPWQSPGPPAPPARLESRQRARLRRRGRSA